MQSYSYAMGVRKKQDTEHKEAITIGIKTAKITTRNTDKNATHRDGSKTKKIVKKRERKLNYNTKKNAFPNCSSKCFYNFLDSCSLGSDND